jgi:hypothetical protein
MSGAALMGGMGTASLELPFGFDKMLFEVGVGGQGAVADAVHYLIVDTQTCLLDVRVGDSDLSLLGCLHLAGASFSSAVTDYTAGYGYGGAASYRQNGGALWVGAGARLRWQTHASFFLEGGADAMYGTVSAGEPNTPGWLQGNVSAGFRL